MVKIQYCKSVWNKLQGAFHPNNFQTFEIEANGKETSLESFPNIWKLYFFSEMTTILRKIPDIQGEKSNGTENLGMPQKDFLFIGILQKAPFDTGKSNRKHEWASNSRLTLTLTKKTV